MEKTFPFRKGIMMDEEGYLHFNDYEKDGEKSMKAKDVVGLLNWMTEQKKSNKK